MQHDLHGNNAGLYFSADTSHYGAVGCQWNSAVSLPSPHLTIIVLRIAEMISHLTKYRSGGPGSIPGTTRKKISGSGTGSTQPREYN
jgi:hypothetical protein